MNEARNKKNIRSELEEEKYYYPVCGGQIGKEEGVVCTGQLQFTDVPTWSSTLLIQ